MKWQSRLMGVSNQAGLTLIEVLMSLFILSVGTVFIFQTFAKVSQAQNAIEIRSDHLFFAMTRLAEMESLILTHPEAVQPNKGFYKSKFNQYFDWITLPAAYDVDLGLSDQILTILQRGVSEDEATVLHLLYTVIYENVSP